MRIELSDGALVALAAAIVVLWLLDRFWPRRRG
jgi:hypothetical protein